MGIIYSKLSDYNVYNVPYTYLKSFFKNPVLETNCGCVYCNSKFWTRNVSSTEKENLYRIIYCVDCFYLTQQTKYLLIDDESALSKPLQIWVSSDLSFLKKIDLLLDLFNRRWGVIPDSLEFSKLIKKLDRYSISELKITCLLQDDIATPKILLAYYFLFTYMHIETQSPYDESEDGIDFELSDPFLQEKGLKKVVEIFKGLLNPNYICYHDFFSVVPYLILESHKTNGMRWIDPSKILVHTNYKVCEKPKFI